MHGFREKCFVKSCIFYVYFWILTRLVMIFVAPCNLLRSILPRKKCPPIEDKILLYSATDLAKKIRQGELKCTEVIKVYMQRIEAVNPIINAVLEDRFNHAIRESMAVDEWIKSKQYSVEELEKTKPLLGVPITIKESIAVKGMTHNAGSLKLTYERLRATEDAPVVKAIKDAGGIIIAVTSTPELCMNWETSNKIIGTTCNPYDVRKTPGGSSGGEAALISSGASLIGIGSDIAGSLRIPAHFTGIFTHKPTPGLVAPNGHFPYSFDPKYAQYLVLGPLTRYVEDLPLILDVIAKTGNIESKIEDKQECSLYKELPVPMKDIKMYYMLDIESRWLFKVDRDNRKVVQNAAKYFQDVHGIQVQQAHVKLMKHAVKVSNFPIINIKDLDNIYAKKEEGPWKELFKYMTCKSKACFLTILCGIELKSFKGGPLLKRKNEESDQIVQSLREEFKALLGNNGVLLCPTLTRNARYHDQMMLHSLDTAWCTIFNIIGMPVTNCPIGRDSNGMPLGIQVVANSGNDRLTIAVATELKKAFGGWTSPPFTGKPSNEVAIAEITRC